MSTFWGRTLFSERSIYVVNEMGWFTGWGGGIRKLQHSPCVGKTATVFALNVYLLEDLTLEQQMFDITSSPKYHY
jgi:hypothetical protein